MNAVTGSQAPAGWYPVDGGQERYWDGATWTDQIRPTSGDTESGPSTRSAIGEAVSNLTKSDQEVPEGTIWHAVGRPLAGIGAGRYRLDSSYLYFEKGTLRTDSQQVPISSVLDVDVKQSMSQKARSVFTVVVHIQRSTGIELVSMDDIPDGRNAQRIINETAHAARHRIQQHQNTVRYEGVAPTAVPTPAASSSPSGDDLASQIQRLAELRNSGILTDEEFASAKARLIGG